MFDIRRKNIHMNIVLMGILMLAWSIIPKQVVFAGDINSNEAGLIAAASGTFDYDGKTYRAGSAYINSLTSYLSGDDVDLTAEQCQKATAQMYDSVAEGIERGYLYEVGSESGDPTENGGPQSAYEEDDSDDDEDDGKSSEKSSDKDDTKVESGENSNKVLSPDNLDVWDSMSNQTEAKNKLQKRPEQEDANASVKLEEGNIVVTTKDNETINLSKKEQLIPDKVVYLIDIIAVIILSVTLICAVILLVTKCMVFKKPKSRRARPGHTKRRKIRRYTRNIITITTAVSFIAIFVLAGIYISIFNKNTIMQNMQSSGYFRYAYSEYISELAKEYKENNTISETIASYEDFLFTVKQNSMKILDGETDIRIPDSNVSPYITNIKKSYMKVFSVGGVLFIINGLIGVIFMVFMDQRRERGVKHTAFAELTAAAFIVIVTVYMAFVKPYLHLYIEPDYLYLFITECILWSVKVMTSISAFAVVLAMLLIGIYNSMKNKSDS